DRADRREIGGEAALAAGAAGVAKGEGGKLGAIPCVVGLCTRRGRQPDGGGQQRKAPDAHAMARPVAAVEPGGTAILPGGSIFMRWRRSCWGQRRPPTSSMWLSRSAGSS